MPLPATFAALQAGGAFMLSLPRLSRRADHSLERLREVGFHQVELVEGIDGISVDPRAIGRALGLYFDVNLSAGEIGCALSMIALWQRVVDDDLPYALVFEDDVLPHPEIESIGPAYWAETPPDADLVLLGNQISPEDLVDPQRRVVTAPAWCFHAYVISNEGARRALSLVRAQLDEEDRWLSAIDIEARNWMQRGQIHHVCWNGTMLVSPYPVAARPGATALGPDVVRAKRNTGLFFQNCALGSAIWPHERASWHPLRRPRPNVLYIAPAAPHRSGNGMAMRAGVTLDGLARECDVTLVVAPYGIPYISEWATERASRSLVLSDELADPFLRRVREMSSAEERQRARLAYPRPLPATWSTPAAAAAIVDFVAAPPDLVYVYRNYLAPLAEPWLTGDRRVPLIVDIDEDDARLLGQLVALCLDEGDMLGAQVAETEVDKLHLFTDQWIKRADLALGSSEEEVAAARHYLGDVPTHVLPNPVPLRGSEGWADPVDVTFVGNFGYAPNEDAARWFCQRVLPDLRRQMGREVRVALAGSWIGPWLEELEGNGVTLIRDPETVTPIYEATTIAVTPLRAGGGTRLKILEAFGHRRAVVSTSRGANGLPITSGRHLLLADTADDFAAACASALSDASLRARLIDAAVEVAIDHAWPRVATSVSELTTRVLDAHRAGIEHGMSFEPSGHVMAREHPRSPSR